MSSPDEVLNFWFGELCEDGTVDPETKKRWFKKSKAFDEEIRDRFGELHRRAHGGELDDWTKDARGRLALVIVLDQFSRNLHRDTGDMYACDLQAARIAVHGMDCGHDVELPISYRVFLYMPFMHTEDLDLQERGVTAFERLADESPEPTRGTCKDYAKYARVHRDIVKQWGRFPHRNKLLQRDTTPDEAEFLTKPGSSF